MRQVGTAVVSAAKELLRLARHQRAALENVQHGFDTSDLLLPDVIFRDLANR